VTAAQGLPPVAADEEVVVSPIVPTPDTPAPASASPFAKQPVVAPAPMAPAGGGKLPGAAPQGFGPSKPGIKGVQRPTAPLKPSADLDTDKDASKELTSRTVVASEDGVATIPLSSGALNRLLFSDQITSAYTASEVLDIVLENRTAIVSFRAARPADVLVLTAGGQYMLRLVPDKTLGAQTVRMKTSKPETHVTSSYQSTLSDLVTAGFRRKAPEGYRIERVNKALATTGALAWYLTLQYRGHQLSIQEYAVANIGALPHPTHPTDLAKLFPVARAVSTDPETLQPGAWGRVIVVVDSDTLDPPEASR